MTAGFEGFGFLAALGMTGGWTPLAGQTPADERRAWRGARGTPMRIRGGFGRGRGRGIRVGGRGDQWAIVEGAASVLHHRRPCSTHSPASCAERCKLYRLWVVRFRRLMTILLLAQALSIATCQMRLKGSLRGGFDSGGGARGGLSSVFCTTAVRVLPIRRLLCRTL